jgi:serpin B
MRSFRLLPLVALPMIACAHSSAAPGVVAAAPVSHSAAAPQPAASGDGFAANYYRTLAATDGNHVFSPESARAAFAMLYAGARGDTAATIATGFGFDRDASKNDVTFGATIASWNASPDPAVKLEVADRIYANLGEPILASFADDMASRFQAPVESVDFAGAPDLSRLHVNAWVDERTNHLIPSLLDPGIIDRTTRTVLVNAVHFDGKWQTPFEPSATHDGTFTTAKGAVSVPFMHQRATLGMAHDGDVTLVSLRYGRGDYSMLVALPDAKDGLSAVESRLDGATIAKWRAAAAPREIALSLPRFRGTDGFSMKDGLTALGMKAIFADDADYSGISAKKLVVSDAVQKTFIRVDEAGTEAAAATAVVTNRALVMQAPAPEVIVDHPFLFFLTDGAGNILFMGRVVDPS